MVAHDHRHLAARVLGEANDADNTDAVVTAAERALRVLCVRLTNVLSAAGCQALVARAIRLAAIEFPFLRGVQAGTGPDMCLDGLQDSAHGVSLEQVKAGLVAVVAQLVGLLELLVGTQVTLHLLSDVWPDAPLGMRTQDAAAPETGS